MFEAQAGEHTEYTHGMMLVLEWQRHSMAFRGQ